MTAELMTLHVRSPRQWRAWLARHHTSSPGVWLVFHNTAYRDLCHLDETFLRSGPTDSEILDRLRDVLEGGAVVAVAGEDLLRGRQDRLAAQRGRHASARGWRGHRFSLS